MPEIENYGRVKDLSDSAINTMGLFGHPAWLNANDCKPLNSLTISHWVQYNRTKMALRRVTVSDIITGVRGVIPNSKLAVHGDYSYDLEIEDMYTILEEITETSDSKNLPIPQLKIDEDENANTSENKEQRYTEDFRQWIAKWQKLLGHVRQIIDEGKPIDFWTETLLKTCIRFLSALWCNPSLMQVMRTETPFITNFHKLHADPISVEELKSFPQPAIDDNLDLDATQEDSLWLKLSSSSIKKLWEHEKSNREKSDNTRTPYCCMGGTNFLRRQKNSSNDKRSLNETQVLERDARDLLGGSLIETMNQQVDDGERKTSKESARTESKRDQAVASSVQEARCNELTPKIHHVPFPVVAPPRQPFLPPPRPFFLQNFWAWNRYPPKVIQAATFKNMQFVSGNFIPPCQPYRIEQMPTQAPTPALHYPPQKLVKSGQLSQTIMEQLRDHFSHQVILQKMQVETPVATPHYYERKKDATKASKTADYAKGCGVANVQLYAHPFISYSPSVKQEATQPNCSPAKRVGSILHPQALHQYGNKQHILQLPSNCSKIRGSLPQQVRLQARPMGNHQELVRPIGKTSSQAPSVLPVLPHHRKKTHVVKVEHTKSKKANHHHHHQPSKENAKHPLKSSPVVKQKLVLKYNSGTVECQRLATIKMSALMLPGNRILQIHRELMPSSEKERSYIGLGQPTPLLKTTAEVPEGKIGPNSNHKLKKTNHASKLQKKYSRTHTAYGKTWCWKGKNHRQRHNVMKGKLESGNLLLRYCNFFKDDILISRIPQEKSNGLYFLEAWLKFSLSEMKDNHCGGDKKIQRRTFRVSSALSKFLRTLTETPNGTKFVSGISKIAKQLKCFKLDVEKRNFTIKKTQKSNKCGDGRNSAKTELSSSKSEPMDATEKYSPSEKLMKRFRFINPLDFHFEIKSWSDKKIENQISAHYFHMIADSLLLDNLFKVKTEYGVVNLVNISDESVTGWVHFKMALQEVFRNVANHLLTDSLAHAPIQSKLYFNSFLSSIYGNTDLGN